MKVLVYTFRTFPKVDELVEIFGDVFVFGKLKEGFKELSIRIAKEKPDYIIGVAKTDGESRFEPVTVNKFSEGRVVKKGTDSIDLFVPDSDTFQVAEKPTTTFCNWTMYQIANFVYNEYPLTRMIFVHVNEQGIPKLAAIKKSLNK